MEQLSKKNRTVILSIIFFIILLILLFLSWLYVFNVYEVKILTRKVSSLNFVVELNPINSLGMKAPFRKMEYSYIIVEGDSSLQSLTDSEDGIINIQLKNDSSKVKFQFTTNKTQNYMLIEIPSNKTE